MFKYSIGVTKNVVINTGNVLNISNKKEVKTLKEELLESLVLACKRNAKGSDEPVGENIHINKNLDAEVLKLNVQEHRSTFKATLKVFLASFKVELLKEALDTAFDYLKSSYMETVIIASRRRESLSVLKKAWIVLQEYVLQRKVLHIGIADIEPDNFVSLVDWARVKPSIYQTPKTTNLPKSNTTNQKITTVAMETFAKKHRVQMVSHCDPPDILPEAVVEKVLLKADNDRWDFTFAWACRIKIHVKRGGALCNKTYIVCLKE